MTNHALHSSERQDWQTPEDPILVRVRRVGPIACDPATAPSNPTFAAMYFSPGGPPLPYPPTFGVWAGPCGLRGAWPERGLTWVNSPYGAHLDGPVEPDREVWRKVDGVRTLVGVGTGWAERIAAHPGERIALTPNRTEVEWFETLHAASDVRAELRRRIPFVDATTGRVGKQPNHGSVLWYRAGARGAEGVRAFVEAFRDVARMLPGGRA